MNIIEATKQALEKGKAIALTDDPILEEAGIYIVPTTCSLYNMAIFSDLTNKYTRNWNPGPEHIISNAWKVVDLKIPFRIAYKLGQGPKKGRTRKETI